MPINKVQPNKKITNLLTGLALAIVLYFGASAAVGNLNPIGRLAAGLATTHNRIVLADGGVITPPPSSH